MDSRGPAEAPRPKWSAILARSPCTLRAEVSSTRSASPRTSRSSSRSAAMPSVTPPLPCSGCGRRSLSNLRTSASSEASRNTTRTVMPRAVSSAIADFSWAPAAVAPNARLRRSTTAANFDTAPLVLAARPAMVGSRPGGRFSTTNQPRSSSDRAAVDRPEPASPVITTMSGCWSAFVIVVPRLERGRDAGGEPRADARHRRDLLGAGRAQLAHRAEALEQRGAPCRAEPRHGVEHARGGRLAALVPVVADREPVRLVADPLQQVQALAAARHDHRVLLAGQPYLLQALGQAADGHVVDAELGEGPRRGGGLGGPAGLLALVQVAAEPAADHLVDRGDVVAGAPDREPAVLALAGQAVLEDDHRRDHVRALQVGHVVALDAQRRVVQAEG